MKKKQYGKLKINAKGSLEFGADFLNGMFEISAKINEGNTLDEILDHIYKTFRKYIPFDRIGLSLIDKSGEKVIAYRSITDAKQVKITAGYEAPLEGSSLNDIIKTGNPRILNDLEVYYKQHPYSESTRLILEEGILSSLTCPLVANNKPVGFMFFSSREKNAYGKDHVDAYIRVSNQISIIIQKARLYEELLNLNDLKNKLLGITAHDLRNPISVIKGCAEILQMDIDPKNNNAVIPNAKQIHDVLDIIGKQCVKMLSLIDDLLDISAIESGTIRFEKKNIELESFLDQILKSNRLIAKSKNIQILSEYSANLPSVAIDPVRMEQVMDNLITNAVKFSNSGTKITVSAKERDSKIIISVTDEGQGIPEEEIPKIFLPFSRTSVTATAGEKGTGLGLAITKKIVELHNGQIWVESKTGTGTRFSFSIPLNANSPESES